MKIIIYHSICWITKNNNTSYLEQRDTWHTRIESSCEMCLYFDPNQKVQIRISLKNRNFAFFLGKLIFFVFWKQSRINFYQLDFVKSLDDDDVMCILMGQKKVTFYFFLLEMFKCWKGLWGCEHTFSLMLKRISFMI